MSDAETINPGAKPMMRRCPCGHYIHFVAQGDEERICATCKRKHVVRYAGRGYTYYWEPAESNGIGDESNAS